MHHELLQQESVPYFTIQKEKNSGLGLQQPSQSDTAADGAVAFGHFGSALFEVFKYFGVADIAYNQPKALPYPTENPFA